MDVVAHLVPETFSGGEPLLPALRAIVEAWTAREHPHRLRVFGLEETPDGWKLLTAPEPPLSFADVVEAARSTPLAERVPWAAARLLEAASAIASLDDVHGEIDCRTVGFEADGRVTLFPPLPRATYAASYTGRALFRHAGLAWMTPEGVQNGPRVPASDVYQLAYIGWCLLSAAQPFRGKNDLEILQATMDRHKSIGRLRDAGIDVPRALDDAIARALSYEPGARFANAADFAKAIAPFAADSASVREAIAARAPRSRSTRLGVLLQGPVQSACPKRWDELAPTDREEVRHCSECALPVQRVRTVAALVPLNAHCVFYEPKS